MLVSDVVKNGIVESIGKDSVTVLIGCAADECQGCKAAMFCRSGDDTLKMTIPKPKGMTLKAGDRVILNGKVHNWLSGWLLLAVLPCATVFVGILAGLLLEWGDIATGCTCLLLLAIYYMILYVCRRHIDRKVDWEILTKEE